MLEFKNVTVSNLRETVISVRNAMRLDVPNSDDDVEWFKGLERAKKLCKNKPGSGHTSWRKGIIVRGMMKYTQYVTKQFQRYHHFEYVQSQSLMHRLTAMTESRRGVKDFCNEYVDEEVIETLESFIVDYNVLSEMNDSEFRKEQAMNAYEFRIWLWKGDNLKHAQRVRKMLHPELQEGLTVENIMRDEAMYITYMLAISNCPMGIELWVEFSTNYEQLAIMAAQRKNHNLKEDWGAFLGMVEALPYADELIFGKGV